VGNSAGVFGNVSDDKLIDINMGQVYLYVGRRALCPMIIVFSAVTWLWLGSHGRKPFLISRHHSAGGTLIESETRMEQIRKVDFSGANKTWSSITEPLSRLRSARSLRPSSIPITPFPMNSHSNSHTDLMLHFCLNRPGLKPQG
jgi:hypothetical protein